MKLIISRPEVEAMVRAKYNLAIDARIVISSGLSRKSKSDYSVEQANTFVKSIDSKDWIYNQKIQCIKDFRTFFSTCGHDGGLVIPNLLMSKLAIESWPQFKAWFLRTRAIPTMDCWR